MKKLIVLMAFVVSMFTIPVFAGIASTKTFDVPNATHGHVSKRHSKKRYKKRSKKRRGYGVVAKINLSTQRMHVYQNGRHKYTWKISSGRSGYSTPIGSYGIHRMHKRYFSRKYNGAPMPHAMFFRGGYAVHGTGSIGRLGRRPSHGCVRLHPSHAAKLFSMVRRHGGRVSISY